MTKRRSISLYFGIGTVALLVSLGVNTCLGPPKFWRNHEGWNEADVIASLGKPRYDSRAYDSRKLGGPYTLGWYHGIGIQFGLEFDSNGVVTKQWQHGK